MGGQRGRQRSEQSIEAENLYRKDMKLVDIAHKLNVPESTVRRWKSTQKWDNPSAADSKKKITERSDNEKTNVEEKPSARKKGSGAPKGNKNGVGHGRPAKHSAYTKLLYQTLSDEEKELLDESVADDPEEALLIEIRMLRKRIIKIESLKTELITSNTKVSVIGQSRTEKAQKIGGKKIGVIEQTTTTNTESTMLAIARLDALLNQFVTRENKLLDSLIHLRTEKEKLEIERQKLELERQKANNEESSSKLVEAWIASFDEEEM